MGECNALAGLCWEEQGKKDRARKAMGRKLEKREGGETEERRVQKRGNKRCLCQTLG